MAQVRHPGAVAEPAQHRQVRIGTDLLAQRCGHRVVHRGDRPRAGDVHRRKVAVLVGAHDHFRTVGGAGGVLDQLAAPVDPRPVVGVGLIGLQQGELRVVAEVHALVAECPAEFEDALHPADAEPLEVELRRDAQIEVQVVGVDVRLERPGVGAAVDLLQDRRLDLQESLGEQRLPDRPQDVAARADEITGRRVDRQVDVAGTHPGLRVGEPPVFVRQRAQTLAQQPPLVDQQGPGSVAALSHPPAGLDEIAEVDAGEVRPGLQRRRIQQQLDVAGPVTQLGERHTAVVATAHHPSGQGHRRIVSGGECLRHRVAGWAARGIGVDPVVLQRLQLGHPHPNLFGQPVPVGPAIGAHQVGIWGAAVKV